MLNRKLATLINQEAIYYRLDHSSLSSMAIKLSDGSYKVFCWNFNETNNTSFLAMWECDDFLNVKDISFFNNISKFEKKELTLTFVPKTKDDYFYWLPNSGQYQADEHLSKMLNYVSKHTIAYFLCDSEILSGVKLAYYEVDDIIENHQRDVRSKQRIKKALENRAKKDVSQPNIFAKLFKKIFS